MFGQVQRWGNRLAIRIPKAVADELKWNQNTQVRETIVDGKLVIETVQRPNYTLEQVLEEITPDKLHGEVDTGKAVGNENW